MKTLMLLLLGSAVVIGGCANPQVQLREQMRAADEEGKREMAEIVNADKARREAYVQAHPEYREAILNRQIAVGMSAGDVTASLAFTSPRGPDNVNTSVSAYGTRYQRFTGAVSQDSDKALTPFRPEKRVQGNVERLRPPGESAEG